MQDLGSDINSDIPGKVIFAWGSLSSISVEEGSLLDITVIAKENVTSCDALLSFSQQESDEFIAAALSDEGEYEDIVFDKLNGRISIVEVLFGDINDDSKINVIDANIARRYAAKLITLSDIQLVAADVNGDGKVNVIDANLIRRFVARLIDVFPV